MSTSLADADPAVGSRLSPNARVQQLYRLRLAECAADVEAAQRLRFEVFNVELGKGLLDSCLSGRDADPFDEVCDHLLVEEVATGLLVGSYRLQTGSCAMVNDGFYSAQEFDFTPLLGPTGRIGDMVELGRACVHRLHRNLVVLGLLWKGIGSYARERGGRYLIGCSSLNSVDPGEGLALYKALSPRYLAPEGWQTTPLPGFECHAPAGPLPAPTRPPKLMSAYFSIGAKICGPPALDAAFGTVDFLTLLDLNTLPPYVANRYGLG